MTSGQWKRQLERWIDDGLLDAILPEIAALKGVMQPPQYHPEGDAFIHTMQAVQLVHDNDDERVFWAVLLHDIGKISTTIELEGRIISHGHDLAGSEMVPVVLSRCRLSHLTEDVQWLVRHHHYHHSWNLKTGQELSPKQARFTRHPLFPLLEKVCAADRAGRVAVL